MGEHVIEVSAQSFKQEVLEDKLPVLVDFWAAWCGPCRMIGPIVEELGKEYQGQVKVAKMNVDENRAVAGELGIMGIPTLILFKNGQEVERIVAALGKEQLKSKIDPHLA